MPEISEREYQFIVEGQRALTTSVESLQTMVRDLTTRLGERYITRQEDETSDRDMRDQLYAYVREQFAIERKASDDTHMAMRKATEDTHMAMRKATDDANQSIRNDINAAHEDIKGKISILMWAIGLLTTAFIVESGWIVTHVNTIQQVVK
jgi:hypothetical protein